VQAQTAWTERKGCATHVACVNQGLTRKERVLLVPKHLARNELRKEVIHFPHCLQRIMQRKDCYQLPGRFPRKTAPVGVGKDLEGIQQVHLRLECNVSVTLPPSERVLWNVNVAESSLNTELTKMINDRHIWDTWPDSAIQLIRPRAHGRLIYGDWQGLPRFLQIST